MKEVLFNKINREILLKKMQENNEQRTTISFYRYIKIANPQLFRDHLFIEFNKLNVLGRIYIAHEGINAQISVPTAQLESFKSCINDIQYLQNIRLNYAIEDNGKSFFKLKIKVRDKIVADGIDDPNFDVNNSGVHLNAKEFNDIISSDATVIVDMRNHYESEVGHFENAICPEVTTFRESLPIISELLADKKDAPLVMYCTGGIRCEKASAYMKYKGFKEVYQLNGGIIEYARQVKANNLENKFKGKNFVFDERLGEKISDEIISRCHQCGEVCDTHINCSNDQCHILFIQCNSCREKYNSCCSLLCSDFNSLDQTEKLKQKGSIEFNGSKFSKGRYKAIGLDVRLDQTAKGLSALQENKS
ncbi:MAG: rhodanese-related sulfurtransferase [Saprospiraceae bacterium]